MVVVPYEDLRIMRRHVTSQAVQRGAECVQRIAIARMILTIQMSCGHNIINPSAPQ